MEAVNTSSLKAFKTDLDTTQRNINTETISDSIEEWSQWSIDGGGILLLGGFLSFLGVFFCVS